MNADPALIGRYDQHKTRQNDFIDAMVDQWRVDAAAGKSDFDIFGRQIAAIDEFRPSYERLAVLVALMVERLAAKETTR